LGVREPIVRAGGLVLAIVYAGIIGWIYARQPQTAAQVSGGLAALVHAYRIDAQAFEDGLTFFHRGQYEAARSAFARADPAERDGRTQFYSAYSYYREGWGRVYSDRTLFEAGLTAVNKAIAVSPNGRIVVDDADLKMHSADELKAELEQGLAHPVHPLAVFSDRK
jgi:hypothetical protein